MTIEIGKTYESRDGAIIKITEMHLTRRLPFIGVVIKGGGIFNEGDAAYFEEDGKWLSLYSTGQDLIREL